jgi:hypothetical protein
MALKARLTAIALLQSTVTAMARRPGTMRLLCKKMGSNIMTPSNRCAPNL